MKPTLRLALTALLILFASAAFPRGAAACTPPPGGLPTFSVADHVNASDVVIEGTVISVGGNYFAQVATIQVTQYIKGGGRAVIVVDGYMAGAMCGTEVRPEMHGIFYIRTDEFGRYHAMQLSQFDAFAEASADNLAEAIAAAEQNPRLVPPAEAAPALTQVAMLLALSPTATSLALPTFEPTATPSPIVPAASSTKMDSLLYGIVAIVIIAVLLLTLGIYLVFRERDKR